MNLNIDDDDSYQPICDLKTGLMNIQLTKEGNDDNDDKDDKPDEREKIQQK